MTAASLAWIICCLRWLKVDRGIVRFHNDAWYFFLAVAGVAWLIFALWHLLTKPNE